MEFKPVRGNPNYEVSDDGQVRNAKGKELHAVRSGRRQPQVCIDGKKKYIHRLVAEAFVPNPHRKKEVRLLNPNMPITKDNVAWCTHAEAQVASYRGVGKPAPGGFILPKKIYVPETGKVYDSISACAIDTKLPRDSIRTALILGTTRNGLHFERKE